MKKRSILTALLAVVLAFVVTLPAFAQLFVPSQVMGYVLHTNARVQIEHMPIQGYNIDGRTFVVAEHLAAYGFAVIWNASTSTLTIERGLSTTQPQNVPQNTHPSGSVAFPFFATNIVTIANGRIVESYNIDGQTVVYIEEIAAIFNAHTYWNSAEGLLSVALPQVQPIEPNRPVSRMGQWDSIQIIGDANFIARNQAALDLIRTGSPEHYEMVLRYVGILRQHSSSGMWYWLDPPEFRIGTGTYMESTTWLATCIVHDAWHSWQAYHYDENPFIDPESDAWFNAEMDAIRVQIEFLQAINAPQHYITHSESMIGQRWWLGPITW
ncbi:MAG: copper amine oxidase N-terminal domain-containing protein [Defluviitaleaceae bacterium]|nr:copper amine oxidase N-terminal domain-containing protein [Defluviitaleaceae bacterium]